MAYVGKPESHDHTPNFLKSANFQAFTTTVTQAQGTLNGVERIVKAGTIYPANDATAQGIIYQDVDVTYNDQPASLIVEGYILKERLPVQPTKEAVEALKEIKFY